MKNLDTRDEKPANKFRPLSMRSAEGFEFKAAQDEGIDEFEVIRLREKFKKLVSESGKSPYEFLTENAERLQRENITEFRYFARRLLYAYRQEVEKCAQSSGARGKKRDVLVEKIAVLSKLCTGENDK